MTLRRTAFLGLATVAGAATMFPARPAKADAPIRVGILPIDNTAEMLYARELGLFTKAGLNVDIQTLANGSASAAAMAGGAIDVGSTDAISMSDAHSRGLPLTYIAPATIYTRANPSYVLLVPVGSPIQTAKDFNGKRIAVSSIRGIVQVPTQAWIDNNGGDSKTTKFVEIPFPAMGAALLTGSVDAAAESEPFVTTFVDTQKFRTISVADRNVAPAFMFSGWATTNDWSNNNRPAVKKLVDVLAATAKWANSNHAQSAQILIEASRLSPAVANRMVRSYYGEYLMASLLQPVIDAAAKYGNIERPFAAAEVFSPAALRQS